MARPRSASSPSCGYRFDDLTCKEKGDHFCRPRADRAQAFIEEICVHTKSIWARRAFVLEDWQRDEIVRPLFGFVRFDTQWNTYVRRYTVGWVELGRGNGKSEIAAAIVLLLLVGDDEEAAEVYGAAKDTKQAGKVGEVAKRMAELSPDLSDRLVFNKQSRRLIDPESSSYYEVIPGDATGELGHNAFGAVVDEVLAQASADLWEALRTAQGKRPQSLLLGFTTAGNDPSGFAAQLHAEMEKIAEHPERAPHVFVYLRNTPKEADPFDEKNWHHANPALGSFLSIETLRQEALEARNDPARENAFRQFRLNQWVQQVTRWMPLHLWDGCGGLIVPEKLHGLKCWGGLDLAATTDLAALTWFFDDDPHSVLWRLFTPQAQMDHLDKHLGGRASVWEREGLLTVTDGDVIDYDAIHDQISEDASDFDVQNIGIDRWNSTATTNWLEKAGIEARLVGQGYLGMSAPMKELMKLVKSKAVNHGGNDAARWNADSIEVKQDPAENIKPVKPDRNASGKRIDGIVALIMAIDGWMRQEPPKSNRSASFGI